MSSSALLKGSLQSVILRLLSENDSMYGYEITQRVRELTNGEIILTQGALYPSLHKLEAEKFVITHTEIVDGRVRKYYRLTPQGTAHAKVKLQESLAFINQLQALLNLKASI